jgi:hypothetical protein
LRFYGGIVSEISAYPEAIQRLEYLRYRIRLRESLEDRFNIMGTVQHWCQRCIDGIRHPCASTFRNEKEPIT